METFSYKKVNACEKTRNVDHLLEHYTQERTRVAELVLKNPENLNQVWNIFSEDNQCQCLMGSGDIYTMAKCPQCQNLSRLTTLKSGCETVPIVIECGRETGKVLQIQKYIRVSPSIKQKELPLNISRRYLSNCNYQSCEPHSADNDQTRFMAMDEFTNGLVVPIVLQKVLPSDIAKNITKTYTGYICGTDGYYLTEKPDFTFTDLPLSFEAVKGGIFQLLCLLDATSKFDFTFGKPGSKYLTFYNSPIQYKHKNIKVKSPLTLKLRDFNHSGLTVNKTRLYATNSLAEAYSRKSIYSPQISTSEDGVSYYKLNNDTASFFIHLRFMGVALYSNSFDFYAFMIAMMANKSFFEIVSGDSGLSRIWGLMWKPCCLEKINARLQKVSGPVEIEQILDLVKGVELRCDIVSYLMSQL